MKSKFILISTIAMLLLTMLACTLGTRAAAPSSGPSTQPSANDAVQPGVTPTTDLVISGPCANVLFPFAPGRQWIYQKLLDSGDGAPTPTPDPLTSRFGISVVEVNENQATLNTVDLGTGATTQTTANCQDGAILDFPLMTLGSLFGGYLAGDLNMTYVSGLLAPSKADLDASGWDMQWQGEYVVVGNVTISAEGEQTSVTLDNSPVRLTWQNAGQETVTVPAGTFENAYKVNRTSEVDASLNVSGLTGKGTVIIETVHWFVPYLGLIKSEITSAHISTMGISFPIEVVGSSVELVEFKTGE